MKRSPRRLRLLALLFLVCAVLVQFIAHWWDHQFSNIGMTAFLAIAALLAWRDWAVRSTTRFQAWIPGLVALVSVAIFFSMFRFVGFKGELVPQFAWRYSTPPALPTPSPSPFSPSPSRNTDNADSAETPDDPSADPRSVAPVANETDFPEFLGPGRRADLPKRHFDLDWNQHPPKVLWRQPIGAGWSGFTIIGDRAITMEQREQEEWTTCYQIEDGRILWNDAVDAYHYHPLGGEGPRATPTYWNGNLYVQGAAGIVSCLKLDTGKVVWRQDLLKMIGISQTEAEQGVTWGRAGSPLVDDNRVIVPLGGTATNAQSLIALDAQTGEEIWRAGDRQISYASPTLAVLHGVKQILSVNEDNCSAHDPATGRELWQTPWEGQSNTGASVSQPVPFDGEFVLLSKGYGGGSAVVQVRRSGDSFEPVELWHHRSLMKTKFTTAIVRGDHAYGLSDGTLECIHLREGKSVWKQSRGTRYEHGQILAVEDVLLILTESGELVLVPITPTGFREIARMPVIEGTTWNTLALSGRRLLVRNGQFAACVELPAREEQIVTTNSNEAQRP